SRARTPRRGLPTFVARGSRGSPRASSRRAALSTIGPGFLARDPDAAASPAPWHRRAALVYMRPDLLIAALELLHLALHRVRVRVTTPDFELGLARLWHDPACV